MPSLFSKFLSLFKTSNKEDSFDLPISTPTKPSSALQTNNALNMINGNLKQYNEMQKACLEIISVENDFKQTISKEKISELLTSKDDIDNSLVLPYLRLSELSPHFTFKEKLDLKTETIDKTVSTICTAITDFVTNPTVMELFIKTTNYTEPEKLLKKTNSVGTSPFSRPFQIIMRYPMLLENLLKESKNDNTNKQLSETILKTKNIAAAINEAKTQAEHNAAKALTELGFSVKKIDNLLNDPYKITAITNITTAKTAEELSNAVISLDDQDINNAIANKKKEDIFTPQTKIDNHKPTTLVQDTAKLLKQNFYLNQIKNKDLKNKITTTLGKNKDINFQAISNSSITIAARFNGYKSRTLYVINMLNEAYTKKNTNNIKKYLEYLGLKNHTENIISSLNLKKPIEIAKNLGNLTHDPKNHVPPSPNTVTTNVQPHSSKT